MDGLTKEENDHLNKYAESLASELEDIDYNSLADLVLDGAQWVLNLKKLKDSI